MVCRVCLKTEPEVSFYASHYLKKKKTSICKKYFYHYNKTRRRMPEVVAKIKGYQKKHYLKQRSTEEGLKRLRYKFSNDRYKGKYGITMEQADILRNLSLNKCNICGEKDVGKYKKLHIDHDHNTGKIRGVLCSLCNTALGSFKDNVKNLQSAIDYLNKNMAEDKEPF